MFRRLSLAALAVTLLQPLRAAPPSSLKFSVEHMDPKTDPGTDFYRYANGHWQDTHSIPPDQVTWSPTTELAELNAARLRELLEKCAEPRADRTPIEKLVGDFYAAAIDGERAEKLKFDPIKPELEKIAALKSKEDLGALAGELHESGVRAFFEAYVAPDSRQSTIYALCFDQGGLGLPDRDYYFEAQFEKERTGYQAHIGKMLTLLGTPEAEVAGTVKAVFTVETALAKGSRKLEETTDPVENYHKLTIAELEKLAPNFAWKRYMAASHSESVETVIVGQPEYLGSLSAALQEVSLDDWKSYLRWHLLIATSPLLHSAAEAENFAFYGTVLNGQPKLDPRWKRSTRRVDGEIGEALGKLYMEHYFNETARQRVAEMVADLEAVYREHLSKVPWMTEATRKEAATKFARFKAKLGGPEKFRDYAGLEVRRDDYVGNVRRASIFESRREVARIGKPVDFTEWEMTTPTVNAYFNPTKNEIVFPAGILQPPFFDPEMDDAVNYGETGATIGHEMTHGFDNDGRKFDAEGNLRDWWTEADAKEFDARTEKIVKQFDEFEALPGLHINGKLTLAENIADFGGLVIAYEALERALTRDPSKRKIIDGFTPEQRFFIAYAQSWASLEREEYLRRSLTTNVHAPDRYRAYAPLLNMPEFYAAFGIKPGAKLYRAPELRPVIW